MLVALVLFRFNMMIQDESSCPICNKDNNCMSSHMWVGCAKCWCVSSDIPDSLIKSLPEYARDNACICKSCVDKYNSGKLTKVDLFMKFHNSQ